MYVYSENDQLHMKSASLDADGIIYKSKLEPYTGANFRAFVDNDYIDITFIPEVIGGKSTYIRNRSFVGTRVENPETAVGVKNGQRPSTSLAKLLLNRLN